MDTDAEVDFTADLDGDFDNPDEEPDFDLKGNFDVDEGIEDDTLNQDNDDGDDNDDESNRQQINPRSNPNNQGEVYTFYSNKDISSTIYKKNKLPPRLLPNKRRALEHFQKNKIYPCPLPGEYNKASKALMNAVVRKRALHNMLDPKKRSQRDSYNMVKIAMERKDQIDFLLKKFNILAENTFLKQWTAKVLVAELLWGSQNIKSSAKEVEAIKYYEEDLREAYLEVTTIMPNPLDADTLKLPTYVRINTLSISIEDAHSAFSKEGWNLLPRCETYTEHLKVVSTLEGTNFMKDFHISELLVFPPLTSFYNHPGYLKGKFIIQDKGNCLSSFLLNPKPNSHVLDVCAAPGLKLNHLANLMGNTGVIYANDFHPERSEAMRKMIELTNMKCVKTLQEDVIDVFDKAESFISEIEYILIDPMCTYSGRFPKSTKSAQKTRLTRAKFNLSLLLRSCLQRCPKVKRVVFTTCTIFDEEAEDIIDDVVQEVKDSFTLLNTKEMLWNEWQSFGKPNHPCGDKCIRIDRECDLCHGYFIAVFERNFDVEVPPYVKRVSKKRKGSESEQNDPDYEPPIKKEKKKGLTPKPLEGINSKKNPTVENSPYKSPYQSDQTNYQPNYQPNKTIFQPKKSRFQPIQSNLQPQQSNFQPKQSNFQPKQSNFQTKQSNFQPKQSNFQPQQSNFQPKPSNFQPKQSNFQPKQSDFQPKQSDFQPKHSGFQPKQSDFQPKHSGFQPKQSDFQPKQSDFQPKHSGFQPKQSDFQPKQSGFQPKQSDFQPKQSNFPPKQSNFPPKQSDFQPQQSNFQQKQSNFQPKHSNFPPKQSNFPPKQSDFQPKQSNFQPKQSNFPPKQSDFQPQQSNFQPKQSEFKQSNFQSNQNNYQPKQSNYQPNQNNYQPNRSNYQPKQSNYQPNQSNYQPNQSNYQKPNQKTSNYQPPKQTTFNYQPPKQTTFNQQPKPSGYNPQQRAPNFSAGQSASNYNPNPKAPVSYPNLGNPVWKRPVQSNFRGSQMAPSFPKANNESKYPGNKPFYETHNKRFQ